MTTAFEKTSDLPPLAEVEPRPASIDDDAEYQALYDSERANLLDGVDTSSAGRPTGTETEYGVATAKKLAYLAFYFTANVSLTIYNKLVLGKVNYPWLLTAIHAGASSLGCYALLVSGTFSLSKLTKNQHATIMAFSVLFTVNIAASNVSLAMVSIPFHQIVRSTTPVFTVLIYRLRYGRSYSRETYLSLIPVVLGVGLATYGDYYYTIMGLILTLTGVVLAAIKGVATNRIMTGPLALSPLESLLRLSPLACTQALIIAFLNGELSAFYNQLTRPADDALAYESLAAEFHTDGASSSAPASFAKLSAWKIILVLACNGFLAFVLNVASFSANKYAGALTITVCGNVKQCLTVLLGIVLFGVKVGLLNGVGMMVALAGAAWYSFVELGRKTAVRALAKG